HCLSVVCLFLFHVTPTSEIYTLSLHDALPIWRSFYEMPEVLRVEKPYTHCICSNGATLYDAAGNCIWKSCFAPELVRALLAILRSEEHTSELQSRFDLVCRLLLEKKKANAETC